MHGAPLRSTVGPIMQVRAVLAVLLVALTSCNKYMDWYSCTNPDKGHRDAHNNPDPCHENDPDAGDAGTDAGETCPGACAPGPPSGWSGPYLLWTGVQADAPHCSDLPGAPREVYSGHGELDAPTHCDACACAPPTGSCELPATLTASAGICPGNGPGVAHTPFDPPPKWGGTCTSENAIPSGKLCGGVPCVQSVTIGPLTLNETECVPIQPSNVQPPATWKKFARACTQEQSQVLCSLKDKDLCVLAAPGPEFKQCISFYGGTTGLSKCPPQYPKRSVFYDSFTDNRSCPACTCDPPMGSTCTGSVSIFSDAACGLSIGSSLQIDAVKGACLDLLPGASLGSKSASEPIFTPGQCAPKFDAATTQFASPQDAVVWCCQDTL
jgi:hypothetical protein